jgi:competence protein ComEA
MWKVWLRHYFGFTASESRGFVALLILLILILLAPTFYAWFLPESEPIDLTIERLKVDSVLTTIEKKETRKKAADLFDFNPNTASEIDLVRLGFPKYIALRMVNYRNKGGKFRVKNDVLKIYGMDKAVFAAVKAHILLPDSISRPVKEFARPEFKSQPKTQQTFSIDMNQADTADWQKINGIGKVLSARIVKFRDKLGGFVRKEQLYEVYGLDSQVVKNNWEKMQLITPAKKWNVNTLSAEELGKHPFIGKKLAQVIVNYRTHHGLFEAEEDLLKTKVIDRDKLAKLEGYLEF